VIIGRTAALRADSMEEAIKRVQACAEAGVDAVFLIGLKDRQEVRTLSQATSLPVLLL
jgi:carboxyvinyl-carboxyphosphonate phosphorylmutase